MDWLDLLAVQGTPESSPTPQFKRINSSVLSFLHINMVKYVFYYVTFTTLKKKEETNGGPWGVL